MKSKQDLIHNILKIWKNSLTFGYKTAFSGDFQAK